MNKSLSNLMLEVIPDFCWQTGLEIVSMFDEYSYSEGNIRAGLSYLVAKGKIKMDRSVYPAKYIKSSP